MNILVAKIVFLIATAIIGFFTWRTATSYGRAYAERQYLIRICCKAIPDDYVMDVDVNHKN